MVQAQRKDMHTPESQCCTSRDQHSCNDVYVLRQVVQKVLTEAVQSGSGNDASGEGGSALGQSEPLTSLAIQKVPSHVCLWSSYRQRILSCARWST